MGEEKALREDLPKIKKIRMEQVTITRTTKDGEVSTFTSNRIKYDLQGVTISPAVDMSADSFIEAFNGLKDEERAALLEKADPACREYILKECAKLKAPGAKAPKVVDPGPMATTPGKPSVPAAAVGATAVTKDGDFLKVIPDGRKFRVTYDDNTPVAIGTVVILTRNLPEGPAKYEMQVSDNKGTLVPTAATPAVPSTPPSKGM